MQNLCLIYITFHLQVDKLEEAESRRVEETDHQEHKSMIMRKYHQYFLLHTNVNT